MGTAVLSRRRLRVVVAEPSRDRHDRGATIIARALGDAGMEIATRTSDQTAEQIAETAVREDADAGWDGRWR